MKKVLFFVSLCGISLSMQAQTDTLQWENLTLQEVEVTAAPRVFANQSVEKKQVEIRQQNIGQNLPYLIQSTPGLVATSDDGLGIGYTYFHLRGTDHTRINMTLNDIPLNDPESQTVFWVNLTDMGSTMESLKVQRGVGTSMNGSSAFGASLHMRTLYDTKRLTAEHPVSATIDFTGGMYNTFRETASLYAKVGQWHIGGRFSKVNSDGYIDRASSDLLSYQAEAGWQSPYKDDGQRTEVTLLAFGGKERTYMAWYGVDEETLNSNRRFNPAGLIAYEQAPGDTTTIAYPNQTDNYTQHHAQLHIRHLFSRQWSLRAAAHYTYGRGYYQMADYGTYSPANGWSGITQDGLTNHLAGANMQAQYLHDVWSAQFGFAAQHYLCDHWGTLDEMDTYLGKGNKTDANLYARFNEYIINQGNERLSLYEDVQYRIVNYRMDGANEYTYSPIDVKRLYHFFNPKAGLEYFNRGHQLTASFAMANREPTRSNFLEADMNAQTLPEAERLYDYELGYNYSFKSTQSGISGMAGINLYFMQYDNQLVATGGISKLSYPTLTNVKDSYRTGIELQYGFDFTGWLRFEGNLVWSRNKWKLTDNTWNTISFSPDWTAYNALDFHVAGFHGVVNNQVVSSQYLDNSERKEASLKAYTVTNLHLSYQLPLQSFRTQANGMPEVEIKCLINNLFNSQYCSNGGTDGTYTWYFPQAGINVHAGLTLRW